ncbi:hypothetical protein MPL3356_310081 [Mesorhizobium plurifarium]|uniref:Uncharacterized protein n=1 Tax=Mesorhizobium plurifarium TaxID=69974 RepID=A0A090FN14_MESPL|nr:hypothetical protein MPL3356_310081 [Mesorhizobium plurifarium]
MAVAPLLDQPEAREADQELAHAGGADADLARQLQLVDLHAGLGALSQQAPHEGALDDLGQRIGLLLGEEILRPWRPEHRLVALVPGDQPGFFHARKNAAHRGAADAEQRAELRFRRQALGFVEQPQTAVESVLVDVVALRHAPYPPTLAAAGRKRDMIGLLAQASEKRNVFRRLAKRAGSGIYRMRATYSEKTIDAKMFFPDKRHYL